MPFIIIGAFLIIGCALFMYFGNNKEKYSREKPEKKDPDNIIYLADYKDEDN